MRPGSRRARPFSFFWKVEEASRTPTLSVPTRNEGEAVRCVHS